MGRLLLYNPEASCYWGYLDQMTFDEIKTNVHVTKAWCLQDKPELSSATLSRDTLSRDLILSAITVD